MSSPPIFSPPAGWPCHSNGRVHQGMQPAGTDPIQAQVEHDPNGLGLHAPGAKFDSGKSPITRGLLKFFPRASLAVAELSGHGALKYSWTGWTEVKDGINRYDDAIGRHQAKEAIEGLFDLDWKTNYGVDVLHAAAVAWNAMARLELILRDLEKEASDDYRML